jgi:hypothetical protein
MSFKDFDTALKAYSATVTKNMEAARSCAIFAMQHFAEHGDTTLMQRFLDAMPKNYARRQAFVTWCHDFAPVDVTHEGKGVVKLIKDKTRADMAVDLEKALKADFWDYSPEKPIVPFTAEGIVEALNKTVHKFHNAKKYEPDTPEDAAYLAEVEAHLKNLPTRPTATPAAMAA